MSVFEPADPSPEVAALQQQIATLRAWADEAATTKVTSANAVNTLQVVVTRLGLFFDRFADLIEQQYGLPDGG